MSLKIAIRDILEKDLPLNMATKKFFQTLLSSLEKDKEKERDRDNIYDNYAREGEVYQK